jgi:hypothetical protein
MRLGFPKIAIVLLAFLALCMSSQGSSLVQEAFPLENNPGRERLCVVAGQVVRADTKTPVRKARVVLTNKDDRIADPYVDVWRRRWDSTH